MRRGTHILEIALYLACAVILVAALLSLVGR